MREAHRFFEYRIEAVGEVRRFVRGVARSWAVDGDDLALVTGELSANAIQHARTPFMVHLSLDQRVTRAGVFDQSDLLPRRRSPKLFEAGGRGILIVEALSRRWGVHLMPTGKIVWAELTTGKARRGAVDAGPVPLP